MSDENPYDDEDWINAHHARQSIGSTNPANYPPELVGTIVALPASGPGFWETPEARTAQAKKVKAAAAVVKAMKKKALDSKRKVKF